MEKQKTRTFPKCLALAKKRGILPEAVVIDTWYSSLDNLKSICSHGWVWVTTLRKNRIVNHNKQLNKLDISEEGTPIHLTRLRLGDCFQIYSQKQPN